MKMRTILKKDMIIVLGIVLLILLLAIGVVYATTVDNQKSSEVIMLEKKVISSNRKKEMMVVPITEKNANQEERKAEETKNQEQEKDYYIKVNYQANTVTVYSKDANQEYTIPEKVFVCSCGEDTPNSGVYATSDKYEWRALVGNVYGQYATRIVGSILFHSVPYERMKDKSSLEYWEYDKLGETASAGCVRLKVEDAKWIYDNCKKGTKVEFYASSNPGPLGKPEIETISDKQELRNWDPTDEDSSNPWMKTKEN